MRRQGMSMGVRVGLWLVVCGSLTHSAGAQVPEMINYQGRVVLNGTNFHGVGSFKFVLGNGDLTATYWSNDGTSTDGGEPAAAVGIEVVKGLFGVQLGDTTLANMTALPATVFTNADVRLRVWFNDGGGFRPLTPDQRITSVGYAMQAGSVAGGGGGALASYDENGTFATAPSATGTDSIAQGVGTSAAGDYSVVGGGADNVIVDSAFATISGGNLNTIMGGATWATICGGSEAVIAQSRYTAIGGGLHNVITNISEYSVIDGGSYNRISDSGWAKIGGGWKNRIGTNAQYSTVGGGSENVIVTNSHYAVISGGSQNEIGAVALCSVIGGGSGNRIADNAQYATIPGGLRGRANHWGTFVWADFNNFDFPSTAANQFSARCTGGARFVSGIDGSGNPNAGVALAAGGNSWSAISDRNVKENFRAVDTREVLDRLSRVEITEWNMKAQNASIVHIGPMAQDFHAAFGLGESERHLNLSDVDGVALAAIQGLYQENQELKARLAEVEKALDEIRNRGL